MKTKKFEAPRNWLGLKLKPPRDWLNLSNLNTIQLVTMGFQRWDSPDANNKVLMLIPGVWLKSIPNGLELESINGSRVIYDSEAKQGDPGYVDDDTRGGYLAYGIRVIKG